MSGHYYIPFEIQIEIIKRLPVKSLIRFRSVSNSWKSLIDSSEFIADYRSLPQRLLGSYNDRVDSEIKFVSIDDDDTFPQRKSSLTVPSIFKFINNLRFLGSSHGLLCLYGCYPARICDVAVLWNPSIRKSVVIKVPNELKSPNRAIVGFGVCPKGNDPKLVKINFISRGSEGETIVEVFTLSSRAWRIPSRNPPCNLILVECSQSHIVIDGFIYWLAICRRTGLDDGFVFYNLIISFDLTSEEFREIYLPEYLGQQFLTTMLISKLNDSLVVLNYFKNGEKLVYDVWMMEHGVPNSFTKIFTIDIPNAWLCMVLGFRENGELMLDMDDVGLATTSRAASLEVYEPSSNQNKDLGIYGEKHSFFVSSYIETLMLLDQPDCSDYFNPFVFQLEGLRLIRHGLH